MPNIQVKLRRGTTAQHGSFTGAEGEVTVDTDKDTVVVHDGSTAGGHELRKKSDTIAGSEIDNDAVDTAQIAANAVTGTEIANDAVTSTKIAANAVTSTEIANDAVTTDKIADSNVSADKVNFPTAVAHARFFGNVGTGTLAQEIAAGTVTWVYGFSAIVSTATTGLYTLTFSSARASGDSYTVVLGREFTSPTTDSIVVKNRTANGFDLHCSHTVNLNTVGLNVVVIG
jgi:hypothetical protein